MAKCKNLRSGFGLEGDGMTDRERLVELIIEAKRTDPETGSFTDYLADYLIEHGVTVLPLEKTVFLTREEAEKALKEREQ